MIYHPLPVAIGHWRMSAPWPIAKILWFFRNQMALFVLLILSCQLAYSQAPFSSTTKVHLGKTHFVQNNLMPSQIVGSDGDITYITKIKLKHELRGEVDFPVLESYNEKMELLMFRELRPTQTDFRPMFEKIVELGNDLFCLYSAVDNKNHSKKVFAQKIDKSTLSLEDEILTLKTIPKASSVLPIVIKKSADSNFLMIIHRLTDKKTDQENIHVSILDKNLHHQWEQSYSIPYEKGTFQVVNYSLNRSGDYCYLLTKTVKRKNDLEKFWEPNYEFHILAFNRESKSASEYRPELEGKFLVNMQIGTTETDKLICAGFYQDQRKSNQAGSYFMLLDASGGTTTKKTFKAFEPDMLDQGDRKPYLEGEMGLFTYSPDELLFRNDGGIVMIAEQATQTAHFDPRSNLPSAQVSYNHIAVTSIDPDGEIMWTRKIEKDQRSSQGYSFFSSFATAVLHDKIYLVFNDNSQNLCQKNCEPVKFTPTSSKKDILIALVEINWIGEVSKSAISMSRDINILTKPSACMQVSRNEMVILGQYNNKYQLAKLEFEKLFSYR